MQSIARYTCNSSHAPSYCANSRYDRPGRMIVERSTTLDQVLAYGNMVGDVMLTSLGIVRDLFVGYILSGGLAFLCYVSVQKSPVFRKINAKRERKS